MNKELVLRTLDAIDVNLDRWNQAEFVDEHSCGTTMCFGGWAMFLSGWKPGTSSGFGTFESPTGEVVFSGMVIEEEARLLLGFDNHQTRSVFHWQPEDHLPVDMNGDVYADKEEQFAAFKAHVLQVIEESK